MSNPTSAIPPFIPGLLIVSLLIVVCLSIGWRNYLRRGLPRTTAVSRVWNWEGLGQESESPKPEKPKMWDVGVSKTNDEVLIKMGDGWEKIMPLSAAPINHDLLNPSVIENIKEPPDSPDRGHIRRFPDFSFLPPPSRRDKQKHSSQSVASPTTLRASSLHHLQVSVIISMPKPTPFTPLRLQNESDSPLAGKHPYTEPNDSLPQSNEDHGEDAEEIPEVAFGVIVVPWLKEGDEGLDMTKGKAPSS
ncbi:hypothetical protein BU17DRAFT_93558 [Hysterangium stoloniferum]|nr:hypothetical protein BU17DRAFT_93558 [Hysterangium stoloniferum]